MQQIAQSVCGDGWVNLCTRITQCALGVQPHPDPKSNQTGPGGQHTHSERSAALQLF